MYDNQKFFEDEQCCLCDKVCAFVCVSQSFQHSRTVLVSCPVGMLAELINQLKQAEMLQQEQPLPFSLCSPQMIWVGKRLLLHI